MKKIINKELTRIFVGQIFLCLLESVNGFVDMIFGGRFLGVSEMSAIGLFNPVNVFMTSMTTLLMVGAGIRGAALYGKGNLKEASRVFSACMCILTIIGVLVTLLLGFGNKAVVSVLAGNESNQELKAYIYGVMLGCIFQLLPTAMAPFLQIMGKGKTVIASCIAMVLCNAVFDYALIGYGAWGMGLASALSFVIQTAIMLTGFWGKNSFIHFTYRMYSPKEYLELIKYGLPGFLCMFVIMIKSACVNRLIISDFESMYLAVLSVCNSLLNLFGAVVLGAANATQIVANTYYGDANEEAVYITIITGLKKVLIATSVLIAVSIIFAPVFAGIFFPQGSEQAHAMIIAMRMLPWYMPLMAVVGIIRVNLLVHGRTGLTAIIAVSDQLCVLAFYYILAAIWGINGIWLAVTFGHGIIFIIVLVVKLIKHERVFDCRKKNENDGIIRKGYEIRDLEDVVRVSEEAQNFCLANCVKQRVAMMSALCIEELTRNIVENGGENVKDGIIVSLVKNNDELRISIKDNCRAFDPKRWLELHSNDDKLKNIGIKMVAKISDEMVYRQNIGMNVITIFIKNADNLETI